MLEGGRREVIAGQGHVGLPPARFLTHGDPVVIDSTAPACSRLGLGVLLGPADKPNAGDARESPATLIGAEARYELHGPRSPSSSGDAAYL